MTSKYTKRVNARNQLAQYVNDAAPRVIEYLRGGFNRKVDGSLFKKDHDAIRAILEEHRPEGYRHTPCIVADQYSLWVQFKNDYPIGDYTVSYLKFDVYLSSYLIDKDEQFVPVPKWTVQQLENAEQDLKGLEEARAELDAKLCNFHELLGHR